MDRSISDVVNHAVRQTLSEDAADLEVFEKRRREPTLDFEEVVLRLRRSGKLQGSHQEIGCQAQDSASP